MSFCLVFRISPLNAKITSLTDDEILTYVCRLKVKNEKGKFDIVLNEG